MPELDEQTRAFIAAAPFLVMATTGADGSCDAGPKGGPPGFVHVRHGYAPADSRISRQSPLRRRSESRHPPGHRPALRRPGHLRDAARQRHRPPHARSRVARGVLRWTDARPGSSPTSRYDRSSATVARRSCARELWNAGELARSRRGQQPEQIDRRRSPPRSGGASRTCAARSRRPTGQGSTANRRGLSRPTCWRRRRGRPIASGCSSTFRRQENWEQTPAGRPGASALRVAAPARRRPSLKGAPHDDPVHAQETHRRRGLRPQVRNGRGRRGALRQWRPGRRDDRRQPPPAQVRQCASRSGTSTTRPRRSTS